MAPRVEAGEVSTSYYCEEKHKEDAELSKPWEGHLTRLRIGNYVAVCVFVASMKRFISLWDGSLNRMNLIKLVVPGFFVFASMTYLFGFFGISFISGDMDDLYKGSDVSKTPTAAPSPSAACNPPSHVLSQYSADQPEVIIVGAGTAGASMAAVLGRQGRKVVLIEKTMQMQDRIVGELLQPGGLRALERMGLEECALQGIDSVRVDGYTIIQPPSGMGLPGKETVLFYPKTDPRNVTEMFGNGVVLSKEAGQGHAAKFTPRGRSFHNCRFVERLREAAAAEENVTFVEGTVTRLLEENGRVVGVELKRPPPGTPPGAPPSAGGDKVTCTLRAPLTIVADGIWSGLRKCANDLKPQQISTFVGVVVQHPEMEAPVPHRNCGHVVLAQPSPILIYQISSMETRVLVDVMGKVPSSGTGELHRHLKEVSAPQLPACFREAFVTAVDKGDIKSMPNRALPATTTLKPGAVLIGDALNMRHPLTGGGMTVALRDVELLTTLFKGLDLTDDSGVGAAVKRFHSERRGHAATINVLANALYQVFSTPEGSGKEREHLQEACFEYLNMGGMYSAGPVGLLAGLTPRPNILTTHFFMVAMYGVRKHLFPLPTPAAFMQTYRLIHVACLIIMPLLAAERSTVLSTWPVRKLVQLLFPWEHMMAF